MSAQKCSPNFSSAKDLQCFLKDHQCFIKKILKYHQCLVLTHKKLSDHNELLGCTSEQIVKQNESELINQSEQRKSS